MEAFRENGCGLEFTAEVPENIKLRFLDLELTFSRDHVCWVYKPRTWKPLLNYESDHPRIMKDAIAVSCIKTAATKSCHHTMLSSLCEQVGRLKNAGYTEHVLSRGCEKVLQCVKEGNHRGDREVSKRDRPVVGPYIHELSSAGCEK